MPETGTGNDSYPGQNDEYAWDWFDRRNAEDFDSDGIAIPDRGAYGVRLGRKVVCLTSRFKAGYERAAAIADALNRGERVDG